MTTWKQLHDENRARELIAKKAAGRGLCRGCTRILREAICQISVKMVECDGGTAQRIDYAPNGQFGYQGFCTRKCAFEWAARNARPFRQFGEDTPNECVGRK